jgi:cytochrome c556
MSVLVRTLLVGIAAAVASMAALAQQDPVATRENLMKQNNRHAVAVVRMARGQQPFDAAAVDAAFAQWADTAQKLPGLFPENTKIGGDNRASPRIWLDKKDFDSKAAAFAKAVAEHRDRAKGSLAGLRAAIPAIAKACDNCHQDYRLPRS